MCGLVGIGLHRGQPTEAELLAMAQTLSHRGPDDAHARVRGNLGLAFRRLSIIDLEGGRQPLENETGDVILVGNGEIYNFRELREELKRGGHRFKTQSDMEVLIHLYEERGEAFVEDLVGMFAFAILDYRPVAGTEPSQPKVLLGRDRLGIKPLYYAETPSGLFWASEPKAILQRGELAREMRPEALLDYLVSGYVGGPLAAWSGMNRLEPGHLLRWQPGGRAQSWRYWDLPLEQLRGECEPEEILEWLDRVVVDRMVADVPLGAFLSGGIDSTAVVTSMARSQADPVVCCSVGFNERSHNELEHARATAERLSAKLHTEILEADPALALETLPWFYDEPLADPSTVPTYLVSRMAREHVTVALSGDGGDETFAGYRRYVHDVAENRLRRSLGSPGRSIARSLGKIYPQMDWAPRFLRGRTFLTNIGDDPAQAYWRSVCQQEPSAIKSLLHGDLLQRLGDYDPSANFREHYARPTVDDSLYRAQYADFHTYLPDQILTKVDRASMAVSLEVRVPILDHRFVERFANLPAASKVRSGRGKHALREALRSRLPSSVLDGQKRGFDTPLAAWIRGPLKATIGDALQTLPAEWFQRELLQERLQQHQSGRRDHARLLWSLFVLEQWRRRHAVSGLSA